MLIQNQLLNAIIFIETFSPTKDYWITSWKA